MVSNKLQLSSAACLAAAALISGCSSISNAPVSSAPMPTATATTAPQSGATQIAFVTNGTSDYWTIARKGTDAAQKDIPGVSVDFLMLPDGTAATQKQDVDDLVAKGVKGIAISPVDPANQTTWLNQIASKAPVITQDSDAPESNRACYIGTDNHAAGFMAGGLIKKAVGPAGGKIMVFVGKKDAQNAHDRYQGIVDALKGSNIQVLDVRTDDGDRGRAKSNAADALVSNPTLAAEVGLWSYNGPAILSAVQDAGKIGKVKIICFDEEDATLAGIKSGAIYGTVVQQPYEFGYDSVKMLAQLVKGDKSGVPPSKTIYVPTQAITSTNVDAFKTRLDKLTGKS